MKKITFIDKFNLTEAVLNGRKTMTRRIVPRGLISKYGHNELSDKSDELLAAALYQVGDIVAVAQAYKDIYNKEYDHSKIPANSGWTNKMYVRAELMPHRIYITGANIERLQDISEEDCMKEGVISSDKYAMPFGIMEANAPNGVFFDYRTPLEAFAILIDKICGKGTWEQNPYVYAYSFVLIK